MILSSTRWNRRERKDRREKMFCFAFSALSGVPSLSSRKLIWVVGEQRVDAEVVEEVRHLGFPRRELPVLVVGAERPRRDGEPGGVRARNHFRMARDDEFLRRDAGGEGRQLLD